MKFLRKILAGFLVVFLVIGLLQISFPQEMTVSAQSSEESLQKLKEEIEEYEREINRLKSQASTLANQIAQFNIQIRLTTLKIAETQERIDMLGGRILQLEGSLDVLTEAFSSRATETYKMARLSQSMSFILSAPDLNEAVLRFHYLQRIQEADRDLLIRLQSAQTTYQDEKLTQEELQSQLEVQKKNLDSQKAAKANLLQVTRNDEKRYQQLLAAARSEYEAIQAILAGKGDEEEIGKVSQGERIASVISGSSCNSSGSHLHFIVSSGTSTLNPFAYLKGGIGFENCSGSACGSSDGDPFNPSGSWDWPVSPSIKFTQGYGSTWAIKNSWVGKIYSFHNGIDVNSQSGSEVKAVRSGTLFRGSYTGYGGCRLRYVRVDHEDSELDTLYLHINY